MAKPITVQDLHHLLTTRAPVQVIDVRRKPDLESAPQKIPAADWHDPERMEDWIPALPAAKEVVVYCVKGGGVSQSVADRLAQEGRRTRFLEGGIKAWRANGGAVE